MQGEAGSVKWGARDDGLLVETPDVTFEPANRGRQVYLWSEQMVEGDVYLGVDSKMPRRGGLALLMFHAKGISREDFMDSSRTNTGATLTGGHVALRVMLHSAVVFRNLRVLAKRPPFSVVATHERPAAGGNGAVAAWA